MIPAIPSVRPSSAADREPYVNLEVGTSNEHSLSGWISFDQNVEGSQISREELRQSARREYAQIAQIASRIFTEFRSELQQVRILKISSRGVSDPIIRRIVSGLLVALSNVSQSMRMEDDEDEFRPSTPAPATMSDSAAGVEFRVNGVLVTPPKPFFDRSRPGYECLEGASPSLRPISQQGAPAAPARPSQYDQLPPGYQFSTPPRPFQVPPAGAVVALPPQLGGMEDGASTFRGRLF